VSAVSTGSFQPRHLLLYDMTLVNCTPHPITLVDGEGNVLLSLEKGQVVPRLSQSTKNVDVLCGISITETVFGETMDMPAPQDNTFYIVSRLVMTANPSRKDLLVPNELLRDENGNIVGCKSLSRN
jgi:hypothetical protein